jgi:hypothetical protein
VEFTQYLIVISNIYSRSKAAVGVEDHQYMLYVFSHFVSKYPSDVIIRHVNEVNKLWHEIFGYLNYYYLQQIRKEGMMTSFSDIKSFDGVC